ncbi:MAG: ribonuclease E/G [Hyphomonadaceae bacterium]
MAKKMLIDAAHPEETRVAVLDGNRVDDFDFETLSKKQLRGNIYLAKVTRVEPSLQAAFVEYGGNRHGFLAFSEIHPDYYRIPTADREALKAEFDAIESENGNGEHGDEEEDEAALERRRQILTRRYRIQEVIQRRQIMLVQVVKEERGNKGAALTTYLSLAGRYCVLMPNTGRGGGISRKITNSTDRKRLKKVATELEVPQGMGLIIRTAGAKRTKTEIKRDYEYLIRAWETIRDNTMRSVAPALIYEESSLVKRAIRDLYDKDVDEIHVEGEAAYKEAKDFVRMLMPSHAKRVQIWRDPTPIFTKQGVEKQLETIYSPVVQLRSGGYIVINQTEALVAIDVNSGRATRERNIEQTALKTNMEAADEAARQMRMRDLAGLIVIDFIDMEENKNDRMVEKRMKDALRFDRARVQMGKISGFGLLELSRQRRRTGVLEGSFHICAHCAGTGRVRSVESSALTLIRAIDETSAKRPGEQLEARAPVDVALYLLNEKRHALAAIESNRDVRIRVAASSSLSPPDYEIVSTGARPVDHIPSEDEAERTRKARAVEEEDRRDAELDEEADAAEAEEGASAEPAMAADNDRSRRRRRGRRGGRRRRENGDGEFAPTQGAAIEGEAFEAAEGGEETEQDEAEGAEAEARPAAEAGGRRRRRRRGRGRRGGAGPENAGADLSPAELAEASAPDNDEEEASAEDFEPVVVAASSTQPVIAAIEEAADAAAVALERVQTSPPRREDVEFVETAVLEEARPTQEPEPEPEAAFAGASAQDDPAYEPDHARRERFLARFSRWGKKT